jgi:hypothetical protein
LSITIPTSFITITGPGYSTINHSITSPSTSLAKTMTII